MRPLAVAIVLALGCAPPRGSDPARPRPRREIRVEMANHYGDLRGLELALILGRSYDVRLRAALLVDLAPPPGGVGEAHVARIRGEARAIAAAPDDPAAIGRLTAMAGACAACHLDTAAPILGSSTPLPPARPSIAARMARHQWAADRLWDGLIEPADQPWQRGLDVLAGSRMTGAALFDDPARQAEGERLATRLNSQATRARATSGTRARAAAYADLLTTCRDCHALAAE